MLGVILGVYLLLLIYILFSPNGRRAFLRILESNRQLYITIWTGESWTTREHRKMLAKHDEEMNRLTQINEVQKLEHENLDPRSLAEWNHTKSCPTCYPGYTRNWKVF